MRRVPLRRPRERPMWERVTPLESDQEYEQPSPTHNEPPEPIKREKLVIPPTPPEPPKEETWEYENLPMPPVEVPEEEDPNDRLDDWGNRDSVGVPATSIPGHLDIPAQLLFLMEPKRYKVLYGGRGSSKSWTIARCLIAIAHTRKVLILCTREFQNSIQDSVLRLLEKQIYLMGLGPWFDIQKTTIVSKLTGAEFIFKGMHRNIQEIKSTEGVDICWVEEAQSVSEESWQILIPTIRGYQGKNTELWVSFNPLSDDDPTYKRFVLTPPPPTLATVMKVGWQDNPWFPKDLENERQYMLRVDPDAYDHVWEGATRRITEATIFRGKYKIEPFDTPETVERFFFGADFGFARDPSVLIRMYMSNNHKRLFIDYEAYGVGIEIDHLHKLYDRIPGARTWPIKADGSRPETISYMRRQGYNIDAAEKWSGSIEDGIAHLKGFEEIIVHERCEHVAQELRLYSYKVDKRTNEILPVPVDAHNHTIDSMRYGLDGYIQSRGGIGIWNML